MLMGGLTDGIVTNRIKEGGMALEEELATYQRKLPELIDEKGKWVLIHGQEVKGIYAAYEDAVKVGYESFGNDKPFLVKKIEEELTSHFISRDICLT